MKWRNFLNYLGQLRLYSFVDILIFATALTRDVGSIVGIGLLWLSFLLYLESRHNDSGRLAIHPFLWLVPLGISILLVPIWVAGGFVCFSYLYTKKKESIFFGMTASVWRGLQNGMLAGMVSFEFAVLAFSLTFFRNIIGDFRDAHDDKMRGIKTVPVVLGVMNNQRWAFYGHLVSVIATTVVWFMYSFLNKSLLPPIILLQIISYPLTPRLSNPKYLDIYYKK